MILGLVFVISMAESMYFLTKKPTAKMAVATKNALRWVIIQVRMLEGQASPTRWKRNC